MKISLIKMIFRRYRKIILCLVMIASVALGMLNGMYNGWLSIDHSISGYLSEYGISDAVIFTEEVSDTDALERLRQVDGVSDAVARLTGNSQIISPSGRILTVQIISMDREDLLRVYHWEDADNLSGDWILAESWFAEHNGISAGDTLQIRTGEDEYRNFTVAALVSSPETMRRTALDSVGRNYPDFGFLYAPVSPLKSETERELSRRTEEWQEKEAEIRQAEKELQESWDSGREELEKARKELEEREAEFENRRAELTEQLKELTVGRLQLVLSQMDLEEADQTAADQKAALTEELTSARTQLEEVEKRQEELAAIRDNLGMMLAQLEDAKGQLQEARNQIEEKQSSLKGTLSTLTKARRVWQQAREAELEIELPESAGGGMASVEELEKRLKELGITSGTLDGLIGQVNAGLTLLENARHRIQMGIRQINETSLPELLAYLEESEKGTEQLAELHAALGNGIAGMEAGLLDIVEYEETAPANREEAEKKLQEVQDGMQAIYQGLEEGEAALAEGRQELEIKSAEAEQSHSAAEEELAEGNRSLQEARQELDTWQGYTPMRNEFLIWFDPEVTDPAAVLKAAENSLGTPVQSAVLYRDSSLAIFINGTLEPIWLMAGVVPPLFVGIMMLVLFLFLSIMIRHSRRSIGILRAMGFTTWQVCLTFGTAGTILMLAASVVGGAFSVLITNIAIRYYQAAMYMPDYIQVFHVPVFLLSVAGFILVAVISALLTAGMIGRIPPAEAVSRQVAAAPRIGRAARALLRRVKPLSKFSLLSLKRNPFRFLTSTLSIAGGTAIIFATLSMLVSSHGLIEEVFSRQLKYEAQILFSEEPEPEAEAKIRSLDFVAAAESYRSGEEEISHDGITETGKIMVLDSDTSMIVLIDSQGRPMAYPSEGIVLSADMARILKVRIGDTVTVGGQKTTVAGIARQMAMEFQYLPSSEAGLLRKTEQTGWLVRLREGADETELTAQMSGEKGYLTILWRRILRAGYEEWFVDYDMYSWMLIVLCGTVGMFIVINTGQNNLLEQQMSMSVLRAIGFQHRELSLHWFLQSVLYLVCSLLIGFVMGKFVAEISLQLMSIPGCRFVYMPSWYQYVWTAVSSVTFILLGHGITMHSMKEWNLAEITKGRE